MRFKLLTLNIHKGFSLFNRRATLHELKEAIRGLGADVVCLQEVWGEHDVHAKRPQFEHLADSIWSHYVYGKNSVYTRGHHGNAILSHFPIESHENFDISNHRLERRGILHATLSAPDWNGKRLHVMTLHLDLLAIGRKRQLEKLAGLVAKRVPSGEPLVVAGDFNDWTEDATDALLDQAGLREVFLTRDGEHARTYPAPYPLLRLDRIYVRDLVVESASRVDGEPWSDLSDHLGLLTGLRL
ncbi:MAG: EEP domain-containing protein [Proteobacteria bacterium]|nr:EEP domain-containing protein [Pseudomonadota bacterium]